MLANNVKIISLLNMPLSCIQFRTIVYYIDVSATLCKRF